MAPPNAARQGADNGAYEALARAFRWDIPQRCNTGEAICGAFAGREPDRPAILREGADGAVETVTYGAIAGTARRLAAALARRGIGRGERVAVLLPQSAEVVAAYVAIARLGAIGVPLAALFGPDALAYRLADSGTRVLITSGAGLAKVAGLREQLPGLELVVSVDGAAPGALGLADLLAEEAGGIAPAETGPDDPALMIYTSGTTGQPKGALHGHRVLWGHMPGFLMGHPDLRDAGARTDALMATPADWAWAGGLLNALMPSLMLGVPVLAWPNRRFVPEEALALMRRRRVTHAFLPPTALRMLQAAHEPGTRYDLCLRSILSAGETLGPETYRWAEGAFGFPINELYGQTECNLVLGSSAALGVSRPGAIGKAVPGHHAAVIRPDGTECAPGEMGEIAIAGPDPVMFLGYWRQPEATAGKFRGRWMLTGDSAVRDAEGYVRFVGREDDLITSAGYRIGPGEIEDCLMRHPAVAQAAVVGEPDAMRTEIVSAHLVLKPGFAASDALTAEIQAFVRARLSAHEYPRRIRYRAALPLTTSGKIIRRALRTGEA